MFTSVFELVNFVVFLFCLCSFSSARSIIARLFEEKGIVVHNNADVVGFTPETSTLIAADGRQFVAEEVFWCTQVLASLFILLSCFVVSDVSNVCCWSFLAQCMYPDHIRRFGSFFITFFNVVAMWCVCVCVCVSCGS
jgi:hypothetical protein